MRQLLCLMISLEVGGAACAQDLNRPDGTLVVMIQNAGLFAALDDADGDGIDDVGKVNPAAGPQTGNCLLVIPGVASSPAVISPPSNGGQFCSNGNSGEQLGAALFGTNFCGPGTNSVVFGNNGTHDAMLHTMPKTGTVNWQTIFACDGVPDVVLRVGDLNGDGSDELWFGLSTNVGRLRFGKRPEDNWSTCPTNLSCDGQVIRRPAGMDSRAYRLGNVGGDSNIDLGFTGSGSLFGLFSFSSDDLDTIAVGQGFKMTSTQAGGVASVVGDIDLDSDGHLDVVIGYDGADSSGFSSNGRIYIVYGGPGGFDFMTDLDAGGPNITRLDGVASLEFLGRLMTALDFDGDGKDDVVVPGATGSIYVLFGRASRFPSGPISSLAPWIARVPAPNMQIEALYSDFDFNNDGREDFGIKGASGQTDHFLVLGRSSELFKDSFE